MPRHEYDPMYGYCMICKRRLPGYPGGYHGEAIDPKAPVCSCYDKGARFLGEKSAPAPEGSEVKI